MVLEAMFCCRFSAKWWLGVIIEINEVENIVFAKFPDLVKNDQTFREFFAHNFQNKTHKKFDGYKKIIKGLENKDIYEDYFPY